MSSHDDLAGNAVRILTYYRQRIWWITSRVLILTVVFTIVGLTVSPQYEATTTLTLLPTRTELGYASSARSVGWTTSPANMLSQTHKEALLSRTLAEDVARGLMSESAAEMANGGFGGMVRRLVVKPVMGLLNHLWMLANTGRWENNSGPVKSLAARIRNRTDVRTVVGSYVFQVNVTWENPKIAARVANMLTDRYVKMTQKAGLEEMRATREYIEARIKETESDLSTVRTTIQEYQVGEKFYDSNTDLDLGLQELSQYMRELSTTRVNWQALDAKINALKPYQTPIALVSVEAERTGLKTRQDALEKVIGEQIAKLDKLPAKEAGLLDLYRHRMIQEHALSGLQDRLLDTRVAEAAQLNTARIIDPAIPPDYPAKPRLVLYAATSVLVGLILSLGFVLATEARRPGLRSRADLDPDAERVAGIVPYVDWDGRHSGKAHTGKTAALLHRLVEGRYDGEPQRQMFKRHMARLFLHLRETGDRSIVAFASVEGGEGKTLLIKHLSKTAKEAGLRTLVVDANFSNPALNRVFGKTAGAGMADVLSGRTTAKSAVTAIEDKLDLIGAGAEGEQGTTLRALSDCKKQLDALAAEYDLVMLELPAFRQAPEAVSLATLADRVVCVFDATSSAHENLLAAREYLRGAATPANWVLNKVKYEADYLFNVSAAPGLPRKAKNG